MQDPYRCLEITVLKKPRSDEAKQLLQRVAKQVQPIMRKRQWTVKKLSEFSPRNPGLLGLNVNRGAEVKIRLRPARDDDSFYDWNHILGTMLHELVHIVIGPHNASFYKLLDELWGEAEDLMDRGISGSGAGFDAPSAGRLGSHAAIPTHNPPQHRMGDAIRKAAEARARQQSLMPSGPRRLGSAPSSSGIDHRTLTPAQAAAAAAERRARDNVWCGAEHTPAEVEQEVGQQPEEDVGVGRPGATAAAAAARGRQRATPPAATAAAAAAGAVAPPTGAAQQQVSGSSGPSSVGQGQLQQPHPSSTTTHQQQQQGLSQQQLALQQQWQQHLQERHSQRQQQQQQQQQQRHRKRPAVDTVDLTLDDSSSSEDERGGEQHPPGTAGGSAAGAAEAAAGGVQQVAVGCPCCAAGVSIGASGLPADAVAAMRRLRQRQGFQQWCELHRQLQEQQGVEAGAAGGASEAGGGWSCSVCTLVNAPGVLVCEACLSVKNVI